MRSHSFLVIYNENDKYKSEDIESILCFIADDKANKWDKRKVWWTIFTFSYWSKDVLEWEYIDSDIHVSNFFKMIKWKEKLIKFLSKENRVMLTIAFDWNAGESTPAIWFEPKIMKNLANIGIEINIELFC